MASEDVVGKSRGDMAVNTIVNLAEEARLAHEGVKGPAHGCLQCKAPPFLCSLSKQASSGSTPTTTASALAPEAMEMQLRCAVVDPRFIDDSQGFMLGNDCILLHVVGSARVLNHEEMGHVDC
ncbi:hypothetical protein CFC21_064048 [Triticum aestivum]|uniref:Uncharacterized protein n=1 Tax=Triticum aestivum TaxID=4565 RepID=A0A9R1KJR8_WHEAT|nr:hypothetical protein CFC21_064048 [Triticum aestivum]